MKSPLESLIQKRDILNELIEEEQEKMKEKDNCYRLPWYIKSSGSHGWVTIADCKGEEIIRGQMDVNLAVFVDKAVNSFPSHQALLESAERIVKARFASGIPTEDWDFLRRAVEEANKHQ